MVEVPETRRERMRGLIGREDLPPGHALLLEGARSIHTIGMRFPLMAAFLDDGLRVVGVKVVRPGRILLPRLRARHVLECPEGSELRLGERLVPAG
jgi:uncharacterized membrane protein (UPF0127 family)